MAKVANGVETLPKISTSWEGRTSVTDRQTTDRRETDDRQQTDGRQHIANVNVNSCSLKIKCLENSETEPRQKMSTACWKLRSHAEITRKPTLRLKWNVVMRISY